MRLSRKAAGLVAAAAMLTAVAPAGAAVASPRSTCYGGRVCLYAGFDFNRGHADLWRDFIQDDSDFADNNWLNWDFTDSWHGIDNETSSIRNRIGCSATLWQHPGYTGAHSTFTHDSNDGFLVNNAVSNNRASALDIWCR
ncbi:peptidase inhibitor family I36 protein [Nonomuraea sp. NPDC049400]|uniref:peptidase inhibitor family I36 protein n=1 Tax=Nonomuraea sp. NPDC049400 TaxID=3364352 RepID=UPI003789CFF2